MIEPSPSLVGLLTTLASIKDSLRSRNNSTVEVLYTSWETETETETDTHQASYNTPREHEIHHNNRFPSQRSKKHRLQQKTNKTGIARNYKRRT